MTWLTSKVFWLRAIERAVKSAAQGGIVYFGGGETFDLWTVDVKGLTSMAVGMFVVSILSSIASTTVGDPEDPDIGS